MLKGAGLFVARAWTQLASTILFIVAARLLTHDEVGIFALATALTMVLTQLVGVGTYEFIIRERMDAEAEHTAFWLNGGVALILALVGAGIAVESGYWFRSDALPPVILALAPLTVPAGCRSIVEALMVRDGKLNKLALTTAVVEGVSLLAGVIALLKGAGLWALVVHKWVQTVGAAVALTLVARWTPKRRFSVETTRTIGHFGAGIFADRVLGFFQTYGVDIFLGALINPAAVALFRVGGRLVTACVTIITEPLRQLNWKRLSDAAHDGHSIPRAAETAIGITLGLMIGPMIGLVVTADLLVRVVLGARWAASASVVQFLAVAAIISTPQLLTEASLGVTSRTRWLPAVRVAGVASLALMLLIFGRHGPTGAALGQLMAAVVFSITAAGLQWRLIGIRPSGYMRPLAVFALAAALMAALVEGCRWGLGQFHLPDIVLLGASVIVGGACYVGVIAIFWRRELLAAWSAWGASRRAAAAAAAP